MADGRVTIETGIDTSGAEKGMKKVDKVLKSAKVSDIKPKVDLNSAKSSFNSFENIAEKSAGNVNKKMNQIGSTIKRVGAIIAATFSVRAIVNFGKQAVETASDLQEVQNVVDTAFGSMSYKMEQFADKAIKTYGISKLTAKRTASTYMAMASGMGIAANEASNMALDLTGLSADMASFYNVSQDIAETA